MNPEKYLHLAKLAYSPTPKQDLKNLEGFEDWKFITALDNQANGYRGLTVQSPEGKLYFAHAGTDPTDVSLNPVGLKDYTSDIQLAVEKVPDQFEDAEKMIQAVSERYPHMQAHHVGHSLGGGLAQLSAHKYGHAAVAFEPPGMKEVLDKVEPLNGVSDTSNFDTYVVRGSIVSWKNTQVGNVEVIDVLPPDEMPLNFIKRHLIENIEPCFENGVLIKSLNKNPEYLNEVLQEKWLQDSIVSQGREVVMTLQEKYKTFEAYKEDYIETYGLKPTTGSKTPIADESTVIQEGAMEYEELDPIDGISIDDLEDAEDLAEDIEQNVFMLLDQLDVFGRNVSMI